MTGGEDRSITAWDLKTGKAAYCIKDAHSSRVKGLVVLGRQNDVMDSEASYLVASSSSDGIIRVWDVRMVCKEVVDPFAEASTRSRLICLAGSPLKCKELFVCSHIFYLSVNLLMCHVAQ